VTAALAYPFDPDATGTLTTARQAAAEWGITIRAAHYRLASGWGRPAGRGWWRVCRLTDLRRERPPGWRVGDPW
jgi:hypothetical protein